MLSLRVPAGGRPTPVVHDARRLPPWALSALALFVACGGNHPAGPTPSAVVPSPTSVSPRVVIVSVDGLRPDALAPAGATAIPALAARGSYTWSAQTILPSTTLPSHASMLSGFPPSIHGITWDDDDPSHGCIPVPTVFAVARAAGLRTVMVVGKPKLEQLEIPGTLDRFVLAAPRDEDVANAAVTQARLGFDVMFVHLPETDLTGHAAGWMSPAYLDAVAGADRAVERVLEAVPDGTTAIVTADHGGHGYNHGTSLAVDLTIPWVIAGPGIAPGHLIRGRVDTVDTAATAAHVVGVRLPSSAPGRTVADAFLAGDPSASAVPVPARAQPRP